METGKKRNLEITKEELVNLTVNKAEKCATKTWFFLPKMPDINIYIYVFLHTEVSKNIWLAFGA